MPGSGAEPRQPPPLPHPRRFSACANAAHTHPEAEDTAPAPQSPPRTSRRLLARCFFRRRVRDPARRCRQSQASPGAPSTGGTAEGALGNARNREGAAALFIHVPPAARAGGAEGPGLTVGGCSEAPEPGRRISRSGGTACACAPRVPPESRRWGIPRGLRPSLPKSPRRRGSLPKSPRAPYLPSAADV